MKTHNSLYDKILKPILKLKKSDEYKFVLIIWKNLYSYWYGIIFKYLRESHHVGGMPPNVPAVYDVLAARIRALRSKDQGRQNVGGVSHGNEA
jgi:hypothetical protein